MMSVQNVTMSVVKNKGKEVFEIQMFKFHGKTSHHVTSLAQSIT